MALRRRRALVAAGARVDVGSSRFLRGVDNRPSWQADAWAAWHQVGELRYATRFQADILSRAQYFAAHLAPDAKVPVPVEQSDLPAGVRRAVLEEMARITDIADIVRRLVVHWQVPGEAYLLIREDETWDVVGVNQLRTDGRNVVRGLSPDFKEAERIDPATSVLARVWQRDEEWPARADSPMRSVLYEVEELLIFGRHVRAVARSRIANSGLLILPSEIDFGPDDDLAPPDGAPGAQQRSTFTARLHRAILEPIHDEGSAAAVTPIVAEVPYEFADRIRFVEMPRSVDPTIDARMDKIFLRIARAWNLPPERLLGMTGTTFANASQIERSEWDAHLAPLASDIAHSIALAWLRPALLERGIAPSVVSKLTIAVDPARAVSNPTIAQDAKDAHKALAISDEALRRSLGFDEGDAPDEEELSRRIAVARGTVDVGITQALLERLLGDLVNRAVGEGRKPPDTQAERDARRDRTRKSPTPAGQDHVSPESILRERVRAAAPFAVERALEAAGARAKAALQGTPAAERVRGVKPSAVLAMGVEVDRRACLLGTGDAFARRVADWARELLGAEVDPEVLARAFEAAVSSREDAAEAVLEEVL